MIAWVPPGYQVILYGCDIALLSGGLGDVDDIVVKDEYVASGSRDKRIKIWNAKRGT